MYGRDKFHRPIVLVRPMIPVNFTLDPQHLLTTVSFVNFYIKENFFAAGKVENWILLFDLEHTEAWNLPLSTLKPFSDTISVMFRCHVAKAFLLNASKTFVWIWNTVKLMLNEI